MSERMEDALFAARFAWREITNYLPDVEGLDELAEVEKLLEGLRAFVGKLEMDTGKEVA